MPDVSADYLADDPAMDPVERDQGLSDEEWEKELERRAKSDSEPARWHIELARMAAQRGNRGKARRHLGEASEATIDDPALQRRIDLVAAGVCATTGDFGCAIDHWHAAAQTSEGRSARWVPSSYAYASWALDHKEQALAWYSAAVRSDVALGRASYAASVGGATELNRVSREIFNAWSQVFAPLQKTVVASIDIDPQGAISRIQFLDSPLDESLIDRIRSVVLRWRFEPTMKDGSPATLSTHLYVDVRGRPAPGGSHDFEIQYAGMKMLREPVKFKYPREALRKGQGGTVSVTVQVGGDGRVESTSIERSSGSTALDTATQRDISSWRYVPDRIDGQPVPTTVTETISFRFDGVENYESGSPRSRYDLATRSYLSRPVGL